MSLLTFMQNITEIKEIMHVHFKNLLAKLYLILVHIFSIVPGLSITCVQVTVLNLHNKDLLLYRNAHSKVSNILFQMISIFHPYTIDVFNYFFGKEYK